MGLAFACHVCEGPHHPTKTPYDIRSRRRERAARTEPRLHDTSTRDKESTAHKPTMGKAEARALAANYMSRIVDPVINPAICYVRMQKPKPDRCCECILDYLKSLQDGDPLSPDRSSLKKPNVAIPDDQSQIIAKCLAEVIGQQPSKEDVLGLLVKAFEKAVDN